MITVVVLTHNDEATLDRTLESLTWSEEIVVVDDSSTDKTVEIAKKYSARIYSHALNDDFAAQRNFGLSKATFDWVLFVDSDEVVTSKLRKEISTLCSFHPHPGGGDAGDKSITGYFLKRRDFLFGQWLDHGETAAVRLLRLARKAVGKWTRPVHEVWEVSGSVGELENPLEHFPHQTTSEFIREINRYSTIDAEFLKKKDVSTSLWQIMIYPIFKFLQNYFWRRGFLDGTAGFVTAMFMSFYSFLKRAKLYLLWDKVQT